MLKNYINEFNFNRMLIYLVAKLFDKIVRIEIVYALFNGGFPLQKDSTPNS